MKEWNMGESPKMEKEEPMKEEGGLNKAMDLVAELKSIASDEGMSMEELIEKCDGMGEEEPSEEPEMGEESKGNPKKLAILIALGKKKKGY